MKKNTRVLSTAALAVVLAAGFAFTASAAEFYKGKRLTVLINYSAGGPTDIEARLFARNIGRLIAGSPQVISKNMAGAGGTVATNYLGAKARPDGKTIGYFTALASTQAFKPLKDRGVRVDPGAFELIATAAGSSYAYIRTDVPPGIKKPEDIMKTKGFTLLGLRSRSSLDLRERLVLDMLGLKYKYVTGYRGTSKARVAVMQGEGDYLTESQPSFRAKVIPTLIKTGEAIGLFYYPLDDGENIYSPASLGKGLDMLPFDKFYEKVKGKKPSGKLWEVFREVNRAGSMAQRSIILPPGSPKAARAALRAAVHKLNKDATFRADAMKTVNFVPVFDVGPAGEKILAASTKLSAGTLKFLKSYIAKVDAKKTN
jgi:tripartite-type tricarboxylate transporter receptor subunit TctC